MNLLNSFAVIVLTLFIVHYVMVNVLNIPMKELVRVPGILGNHGLSNVNVNVNAGESHDRTSSQPKLELAQIERELRASFGVAGSTDHSVPAETNVNSNPNNLLTSALPDPFRVQAMYDPQKDRNYPISAANDEIYEKEAQFGNEQTNVSQFFALNPGVFFNDQRHNAYVPDVSSWNVNGQQMFSQMVNAPRQLLQAYGYDKHYDPAR